jgi:ubiquinone/menaquinone biosynthesis C-methylase UbiE
MKSHLKTDSVKQTQYEIWTNAAASFAKADALWVRLSSPLTERMIALGGIKEGHRVLDIASGTGEPALTIAKHVGPTGHVTGTDFVEEMLVFARAKARELGLDNVEFRRVDGEEIDFPDGSFDSITNRGGLMFMAEPVAALERCHRALRNRGTVVVMSWAAADENPWAMIPLGVLKKYIDVPTPPPGTPGMFAFANPDRLRSVFEVAGFRDILVDRVPMSVSDHDTGLDYFAFIRQFAGPIASLYDQLPADTQAAVDREVAFEAEKMTTDGRVMVPGVSLVAVGTK